MSRPSAVPAIIDSLIAGLNAALDSALWTVVDGPDYTLDVGYRVYVGTDDPSRDTREVAASTWEDPTVGYGVHDETVTLSCTIEAHEYGLAIADVRTAAFGALEALRGVLAGIPRSVACSALVESHTAYQALTDDRGVVCTIVPRLTFTIIDA